MLSHALSHAIYQTIERMPRGYDSVGCVAYTNEKKAYEGDKACAMSGKHTNISLVPVPWSHRHMWRTHTMVDSRVRLKDLLSNLYSFTS